MRYSVGILVCGIAVCGACSDEDGDPTIGTTVDGVTCTAGSYVGISTRYGVDEAWMIGDRIVAVGGYDDTIDMRNVIVVDHASLTQTAEWFWQWSGPVIGPSTSPGIVSGPNTTYYPVDPSTGALGTGVLLKSGSAGVTDSRVFGAETHAVSHTPASAYVFDASGTLLRTMSLPSGSSSVPSSHTIVILDDALIGLGEWSLDDYIRLRRWDRSGTLIAERDYTATELNMANVNTVKVVRSGASATLIAAFADRIEMYPVDSTLALGPAIVEVGAIPSNRSAEPQADGFSIGWSTNDNGKAEIRGLHIADDGSITRVEVDCWHANGSSMPFGVSTPRDASRPTWVFNVGKQTWVYSP